MIAPHGEGSPPAGVAHMNWSNVKLILFREVRDQLRDRRTLFMIFVLPLLMYPLLGLSMFQIAQFVREQPTRVLVIGAERLVDSSGDDALPKLPLLLDERAFAERLFSRADDARLLEVIREDGGDPAEGAPEIATRARELVDSEAYEAVVYFPPDFAEQLSAFRHGLLAKADAKTTPATPEATAERPVPSPKIFFNTAKEKSQLSYFRISEVLAKWTGEIGQQNLAATHLPATVAKPFDVDDEDVADEGQREAAIWAKVLPFLLLIWALTGAFYPAIDLCAGEKERGTLETLLSSPAERGEIVWGKLLTVMLFSLATAVLNILSLGLTGVAVISQFPQFGPPPPSAPFWLLLALIPTSAMFSALCLALAAFARSSKEGQYYLMPLVLVTMPLVILPMTPGVELDPGTSLIPVTGVVLLLRSMLLGEYLSALPYVLPVTMVTLACCWFAIRWAVDQFNSEGVLFRESERLDLGLWVRHLRRDRDETPTVGLAVFCGVLILMLRFFISLSLPQATTFDELAVQSMVVQLVVVATPALLMTIMLTRSPRQTLLLRRPPLASVPAALLLAVAVHPAVNWLGLLVRTLYPINEQVAQQMEALFRGQQIPLGTLLLVMAVIPALFEELAFRGFILSGFRHLGHKWRAIALASLFFGVAHAVFQQSIITFFVGALIGYLAVQTGSLLPGIVFHFAHNAMAMISLRLTTEAYDGSPALHWLVSRPDEHGFTYLWPAVLGASLVAVGLLLWFRRLPYLKTAEERLQEALDQQAAPVAG